MYGSFEGYVTLSGTDSLTSGSSVQFRNAYVYCDEACEWSMHGAHEIKWSRYGDTVAAEYWQETDLSARTLVSGQAAAGECYFATQWATAYFNGGKLKGVTVPWTPYDLGVGEWQSSSVCRPAPPQDRPVIYETSELCPLILDLDGDGIPTTGLEDPVRFWTYNSATVLSGWTTRDSRDAFLWLAHPASREVTESDLFGSRMPSADGELHRTGFQALSQYDEVSYGGDGDHAITKNDRVWPRLRLWIDVDHDGVATADELSPLGAEQIVALPLYRYHHHLTYPNGNGLMLVGRFLRRAGDVVEVRPMVDLYFTYRR